MARLPALGLLLAATLVLAPTAQASGVTLSKIAKVMRAHGVEVEKIDRGGEFPEIRAREHGLAFSLYLFECLKGPDCRAMQFESSFEYEDEDALEVVNDWNRNRAFGTASTDRESTVWLEMDVAIGAVMNDEEIGALLERWSDLLQSFPRHIKW